MKPRIVNVGRRKEDYPSIKAAMDGESKLVTGRDLIIRCFPHVESEAVIVDRAVTIEAVNEPT